MDKEYTNDARVFKALCDEKRLAILALLRSGEKCVCDLSEQMKIGQSSLSYHMKILCESGIVKGRQDGKWTHYRIDPQGSRNALVLLSQITTPDKEAGK
ncbi:helix-turn-helix transcriptional regulator [uncultured Dubosiella sp.]|jgi:ArsR family transcriptional regulator|uniref:ArsR/SmtB family transcription factor n=2 Tax=uncultured Dubosiella sp. TaxID=1937011 RepID=UPI00208BABE1|nr:metalloregulator ArsR/SmtB family transcription factor [uncultured Dubosiella sp.]GJM56617.1 transcriptional regulator [Erysipelotrichaceae bacterium OPF54]